MPTSTVDLRDIVVTSPMAVSNAKASRSIYGRDAAKIVLQKLARQLPPHDFDPRHCGSLRGESERSTMEEFVETRVRSALGKGLVARYSPGTGVSTFCHECQKPVLPGQLTVTATRATVLAESPSSAPAWHRECFVCRQCREQLFEQVYFWSADDATIYCGRHHAEMLRPRCAACDEIIFADECTEADDQFWHVDHFRCTECELPLAGQRYVIAGDTGDIGRQPYCSLCYNAVHANFCLTCGHVIQAGQRHVTLKGTGCWHADGDCFRCDYCRRQLLGQPFILRDSLTNSGDSNGNELFCSDICCFRRLHDEVEQIDDRSPDGDSVHERIESAISTETVQISSLSTDEKKVATHFDSELFCAAYLGRSPLTGTKVVGDSVKKRSDIKRRQDDFEKSSLRPEIDGEPHNFHNDEELLGRPPNEKISKSESISCRRLVTEKFYSASRVTSV